MSSTACGIHCRTCGVDMLVTSIDGEGFRDYEIPDLLRVVEVADVLASLAGLPVQVHFEFGVSKRLDLAWFAAHRGHAIGVLDEFAGWRGGRS